MTPFDLPELADRPRILVVIASYGARNLSLLKQVIRRYQGMTLDVDVKVVSNDPKDLGPEVEVVVGLPSKNPWSLPFAHKAIFAGNLEKYDYFVYSEDDIGVTEGNILAFIGVSRSLASDEIAGFIRFEVAGSGSRSYPDFHEGFHWKPDSVRQRGEHIVAEFTNLHAAFYVLSREQLRQAIASGGFLREPYEGEYDMLCSAATDPYTSCGFRKVVCVSSLEDFTLHHLSNRYAGQVGISSDCLESQLCALIGIAEGTHPVSELLELRCSWPSGRWAKSYYEKPNAALLELIPRGARTVLSIGCGSGQTEALLMKQGLNVMALPLDSVIGSVPARLGVPVLYGKLNQCEEELNDQVFDCVIATNLLHLVPDLEQTLRVLSRHVRQGGNLLIAGPNFGSVKVVIKRTLNIKGFGLLNSFDRGGVRTVGPGALNRYLKKLGMRVDSVRWLTASSDALVAAKLGQAWASDWLLRASI